MLPERGSRAVSSIFVASCVCVALALAVCLTIFIPRNSSADWLNTTGAETAPNFAEIEVLGDQLRVTLEIDPADYAAFVPTAAAPRQVGAAPDLSLLSGSPDEAFKVIADGNSLLSAKLLEIDVRPRKAKPTALRPVGMPPPPPGPPRSKEVVRAVLEYPFPGRPARLSFAPPLDTKGRSAATVGFIARHLRVPVSDYRYLSQPETLKLDWNDPWYSAFENPNLARHHRSALMSFISIEPREIRHEIILRLRDLEEWTNLNLGESRTLNASQIAVVKSAAARFLSERNPITIDGTATDPTAAEVELLDVSAAGLRIIEDPVALDRASALLGVILSYPQSKLPSRLAMTWQLFPGDENKIPSSVADPAGGVPGQITPAYPEVTWTNYLKTWKEPATFPVVVDVDRTVGVPIPSSLLLLLGGIAVLLAARSRRRCWIAGAITAVLAAIVALPLGIVQFPLPGDPPDDALAPKITEAMLRNAAVAMLEKQPERFNVALSSFVSADAFGTVGKEMLRGLSVNLPSGARALTEAIENVAVEKITRSGNELSLLTRWTAKVSGGHWGHIHRRRIRYRALLDLAEADGAWKLRGLTVISASPAK